MKAEILNKVILKNLPSASGIEVINQNIYIIGDDSPYLYCLDFNFNIIEQIELFKSNDFSTGRIPKNLKADFECITKLEIDGKPHLLICGSGSNSNREKAFLVNPEENYSVQEFSLSALFQAIKENTTLTKNNVLNIEGLAASNNHIYFFDRENNVIFFYELKVFFDYLRGKITDVPLPSFNRFNLEGMNNVKASFSGADIFNNNSFKGASVSEYINKIFFTASVEDTPDAISDGTVYGSFIGYIEFDENLKLLPMVKDYTVIMEDNNIFTGKVESISVYQKINSYEYLTFVVTDDDRGGSELLKLRINL